MMYNINLEQFKSTLQKIFISSHKRLQEHLLALHGEFPLKSLATVGSLMLMLDDIFVDLKLIAEAANEQLEFLAEEKEDIWSYLSLEGNRQFVIVGSAGSGKTTLLKHITLELADHKKQTLNNRPLKLPILLFLPAHAAQIVAQPTYTLAQAAHDATIRNQMPYPLSPDWFSKQLEEGECLVMLDGYDEIAHPEARQSVLKWIEQQRSLYKNNQFIITLRPYDYHDAPFASCTILKIQPFTDEQVRRFVEQWVMSNQKLASKVLQQIDESPALATLAANPLYLTMIMIISRSHASLPTSLPNLYAELYQFLLSAITHELEFKLTAHQKQQLLQELAYQMMSHKQIEVPIDEALQLIQEPLERFNPKVEAGPFLRMISHDSGLIVLQGGCYRFAHLTFQEHLAAIYMQEKGLEERLMAQIKESWWHQTINFYYANNDLGSLLERCLKKPSPSLLKLASRCVLEAEEGLSRQIEAKILFQLLEKLQKQALDSEPERRRWAGELLLALRLKNMKQVDENLYTTTSLITHAEYQLFLDEQEAKGYYYRPDHWQEKHFAVGNANKPVVGIRPLDAVNFCQWLTERDHAGWHYRLPNLNELENVELLTKSKYSESMARQVEPATVLKRAECLTHPMTSQQPYLADDEAVIGYWVQGSTPYEYDLEEAPTVWIPISTLENRLCSDLERAKALSFEYDCHTAHTLINKLIPNEIYIRPLDLAGAYANAHAFVIELAQDIDLALTRTLAREGIRGRHTTTTETNTLDFNHDLDLINALDRALALDHDIIINREVVYKKDMSAQEYEFLRWYTRFVTWLVTDVLYSTLSTKMQPSFLNTFNRRRKKDEKWDKKVQSIVEQYFNLYIDLVILEERIEGNLPAFEGIRIMKERG